MSRLPEIFGSMVFNDDVMSAKLSDDAYKSLHKTIEEGRELGVHVASVVAAAMKDWAIEKGATHYTHWFQPMTGITAEKHDSFLSPQPGGRAIMEFSGKELIRGEPDASSFPSGGLRATFEARGYTAWDPSSYAFIKDYTLYIPTVFYSYGGEVLDKKTPLLRSCEAISTQSVRVLNLLGYKDVTRVTAMAGPEQEYFLIDKECFMKRRDLIFAGRTLFGAKAPKGQELEDHYFGAIRPRVRKYMQELNEELWKLGVFAKTEHNEVAPAQHELAPIYTNINTASDNNQLMMEVMKKVADRHGLACLLAEKPFAGVNGSGKHLNWSIRTNTGINLLDPGKEPENNTVFLIFLSAIIKAVDEHQGLLRNTAASAGNDNRLGANEAPPAIVSIFLGSELTAILDAIEKGAAYDPVKASTTNAGVCILPGFQKDTTDRNRTSPFAFTGNKFEFRMPGSSFSIADSSTVLNTMVADALCRFADELEKADDIESAILHIVKETCSKHKRIVFNGNNYAPEWVVEAGKRGLLNLRTTVDALEHFISKKSMDLLTKHSIFTEAEIRSRYEILLENYCKVLGIEALTMLDMAKRDILPAAVEYSKMLADSVAVKKSICIDVSQDAAVVITDKLTKLTSSLHRKTEALDVALLAARVPEDNKARAELYRDKILPAMQELRAVADEIETIVGAGYWPYPTYGELLFSV